MSDLSTMIKRFFLPVILSTAVIYSPVHANTVRITGPTQGVQPTASSLPANTGASTPSSANALRYGPTTNVETLWSIATRYRPNNQVSIYQVIGAIFRQNPQAFENSNIHGLVPGSMLAIPTEAQMRRESIDVVKQRLEADQRTPSRNQTRTTATSSPVTTPKPTAAKPESRPEPVAQAPKPDPKVASKPEPTVVAQVQEKPKPVVETVVKAAEPAPKAALIPPKPTALQVQLDASDEQMTKLLESNHLLRVRLAEMQHEVSALKQQVTDDEALREQIKGFIDQQRAMQTQMVEPQPSLFDRLISNPLMLAAMALIPGVLIAGLLAYFLLGRKREAEDDVKSLDAPQSQDEAAMMPPPPPMPADDEDMPSLTLGDDEELDDLFGDDDSLFDDPESSLFGQESSLASKEDSNSFDIAGDLGGNLGASSISVNSDDEAIGLEDMERALDEMDKKPEPNSDEELAAMWEQSLQADDDDEDSFDLSYDGDELDLDAPMAPSVDEEQIVDQAMLDELFSSAVTDETKESKIQPDQMVGQDELDALFDSVDVDSLDVDNAVIDANAVNSVQAEQAAVDQALADIELMDSPATEDDFSSMLDDAIDDAADMSASDPTVLLDELLDDDDSLTSEIELEEDSTALLDELLYEPETDSLLGSHDIEINENSTELLDELLADADDLDEAGLGGSGLSDLVEEPLVLDDISIEEDSTELLDDILDQYTETDQPADADATELEGRVVVEPEPLAKEPEIDEIEQLLSSADASMLDTSEPDDSAEIEAIGQTVEQLLESLEADEQADSEEIILDEPAFDFAADTQQSQVHEASQGEPDVQELESPEAQENKTSDQSEHNSEEFPIFDEETLLAELDEEPRIENVAQQAVEEPVKHEFDNAPLTLDDLPEFDEEAAFNDPDVELQQEQEQELSEDDEQAMLDNIVRQLQQAAEAAEKPQVNEEPLDAVVAEQHVQPEPQAPASPYSLHGHPDIEFETLDPASLPEFNEDEALQASFDEQHELEQYEVEQGFKPQASASQPPVSQAAVPQVPEPVTAEPAMAEALAPAAQLSDEFVDSAGLDMDALLNDPELQADWEREQLVGRSENVAGDSSADEHLSAEENAIWTASNPEPELEGEDWGDQPEMNIEDVPAFDEDDLLVDDGADSEIVVEGEVNEPQPAMEEAASELVDESPVTEPVYRQAPDASYISIDELMKDLDGEESNSELDEAPLNLDVGLDEFPDVLADIGSLDIDSQGEFASKLDLAKAYLEMNDSEGARGLLDEVAQGGDGDLQREAKSLLVKMRG
ncbi:FimV/HubP family polar landmark protein [Photobacterium sp. DNB22_13_2]